MTIARPRGRSRRRLALLAAAVVAVLVVFLGGYIAGNRSGGTPAGSHVLQLRGTSAAPDALASLRIDPADAAGNWPMALSATGLPALPKRSYYEVYLVRDGKPFLPCGTFLVRGADSAVTVTLNDPYEYQRGDSWIVTKHLPGGPEPGQTVLRPVT